MKKSTGKYFRIAAICLLLILASLCLFACDNGSGFRFKTGTKVNDVLKMFDDGTVTSCAYTESSTYSKTGYTSVKSYEATKTILHYKWDDDYEKWTVYDLEENKIYTIDVLPFVSYSWQPIASWDDQTALEGLRNMLANTSQYASEISIKGSTVTMEETVRLSTSTTKVQYVWSDFNNIQLSLPEEYANYKALAVRSDGGYH